MSHRPNVFRLFWNCPSVVDDARRVGGRSFQAEGPETVKASCPYVDVLAQGTVRSPCDAERKKRRPLIATGIRISARYDGAAPRTHAGPAGYMCTWCTVLITHTDESRGSKAFSRVCLCLRLSVCPWHDRTKTAETTITKLSTGIVQHEFYLHTCRSKDQRSWLQGQSAERRSWVMHFIEWSRAGFRGPGGSDRSFLSNPSVVATSAPPQTPPQWSTATMNN